MALSLVGTMDLLQTAGLHSSWLPLVMGGITLFRPWLLSEANAKKRVDFVRQKVIEKTTKTCKRMLDRQQEVFSKDWDDDQGNAEVAGDHAEELFRGVEICRLLDKLYMGIKAIYIHFLVYFVISVIMVPVAYCVDTIRAYLALLGFAIFAFQVVGVINNRLLSSRLETYEKTS